jgi:hypothetical protein
MLHKFRRLLASRLSAGSAHETVRRFVAKTTVVFLVMAVSFIAVVHDRERPAGAAVTGNTPWAVLLCKASDQNQVVHPPSYYQQLFTTSNPASPTIFDYFWQVSNYQVNLFYSWVSTQWFTTNKTLAQLRSENRAQKLQDCADAAGREISNPENYFGIIAIYNVDFGGSGDSGAIQTGGFPVTLNGHSQPYGAVVLEPWSTWPSFISHEMGHGYGLEHTFATVPCYTLASSPYEYCDSFDVMSYISSVKTFHEPAWADPASDGSWDAGGPRLNAFNLDKLGWIPPGRRYDWNPSPSTCGSTPCTSLVTLTSLSAPGASGFMMAKVPIGDYPSHYYTVEFRQNINWDRAFPGDGVLIHEAKNDGLAGHSQPESYLVNGGTDGGYRGAGSVFRDTGHNLRISVTSVDNPPGTATIMIGPDAQVPGAATNVSIGADGSVWKIGADPNGPYGNHIYRWNDTTSSWTAFDGAGIRIAVGPDGLPWILTNGGGIWRFSDSDFSWHQVPGLATDISIGADGSVWVIGTDPYGPYGNHIYRWNDTTASWTQYPGAALRIAVDPTGSPWAVNKGEGVFRWNDSDYAWHYVG